MVRISAGSAIRTFIAAIALLAPLLIGAAALAQEMNPGFRGTDTLAYKVMYGNGKSGSTTITINVR